MHLSLQTFQQLLQRMSAAVQSSAGQLIDLSIGSMLRAILEANASIGLWIQWLIVQTLSMTRASTSSGADLDSWMADFLLVRQPATASRGIATFSRLLIDKPLLIPAGTLVKSLAGNLAFMVIGDEARSTWQPDLDSYIFQTGISAIDLPIVAQTAGAQGNIAAGSISVVASAVPGLDFVSNAGPLSGGYDAESDDQFRARFRDYINSRSLATTTAVAYALRSLQQNLRHKIFENRDATGTWMPGNFLIVADDGSGQLDATLQADIHEVTNRVRPVGSSFTVRVTDVVPVTIVISIVPGTGTVDTTAASAIVDAVTEFVDLLGIGATLSITRIVEIAYRSGHLIGNIGSVSINGSSTDLSCPEFGVFHTQSVAVQ